MRKVPGRTLCLVVGALAALGGEEPPPGAVEPVRAYVVSAAVEPRAVVTLADEEGRQLPVWSTRDQAEGLRQTMEHKWFPRPMTHDLMAQLVTALDARLDSICIGLKGNTFYAVLKLRRGEALLEVDARCSDALNLALRLDAPIFVGRGLMELEAKGLAAAQDLRFDWRGFLARPPADGLVGRCGNVMPQADGTAKLVLPPQNAEQAVLPAELVQKYGLFDAETVAVWARAGGDALPLAESLGLRRFHGLIEVGPEGDAVAWLGHAETVPMVVTLTAAQVAGFGLRSGDTIIGWAAPPAEGESRWPMVDTPETALPDEER